MSLIFITNLTTGEITQVESNDNVIMHTVDTSGKYLGLLPNTANTYQVSCEPPGTNWTWVVDKWIKDPPTLSEAKVAKWDFIKECRYTALNSPLTTPYGIFDADATSRTNITDAVLMLQTLTGLGTPVSIDFTLANNSVVTLTTEEMVTVGLLLGQQTQTIHGIARALRQNINNATTIEELGSITWPV